jgi:hypothetical protein
MPSTKSKTLCLSTSRRLQKGPATTGPMAMLGFLFSRTDPAVRVRVRVRVPSTLGAPPMPPKSPARVPTVARPYAHALQRAGEPGFRLGGDGADRWVSTSVGAYGRKRPRVPLSESPPSATAVAS